MQDASALGGILQWTDEVSNLLSMINEFLQGIFHTLGFPNILIFSQSLRKLIRFKHNKNLYDNMKFGLWKCKYSLCFLTFINFYELVKIKNSVKISKFRNCFC